ncbi:MAG: choice-of-anchor I family protein [Bacillota bacterium]|jgi:hypothetical protein
MKLRTRILAAFLTFAICLSAAPISFAAPAGHLIINQIYGGGGKSDTPFSRSFIELYNPTDQEIDLSEYKITYSSNRENSENKHAGSTWQSDGSVAVKELNLSGKVGAGQSFLIGCADEALEKNQEFLIVLNDEAVDLTWDQVIDNDKSVEIKLLKNDAYVDGVSTRSEGFQNIGEGESPAVEKVSKQKSVRRVNFSDTDNNAADFYEIVWNSLPADETAKQTFISTYKPRSLADGAWTENIEPPADAGGSAEPPAADKTYYTEGFENSDNDPGDIDTELLGRYVTGISNKDGGVAEIVSYDQKSNRAYVVNGATGKLDIVSLNPVTSASSSKLTAETSLDIAALTADIDPDFQYGDMTSVAVSAKNGITAVALQDARYAENGRIALFNRNAECLALLEAGVQPDMITFTPDESRILAANEGEPREGYGAGSADPKGSVTVITLNTANLQQSLCENVYFNIDNSRTELIEKGVILKKDAAVSADLEPEYIACTDQKAYVTLQEANAVAVLDITDREQYASGTAWEIYSLGYKDLSLEDNAIDLTEDNKYEPKTYPDAVGAYMPDGISLYEKDGKTYLLTANEGDAREWGSDTSEYCNESKVTLTAADGTEAKKVRVLDSASCEGLPQGKSVLFGGRSFSIYEAEENGLTQIYDSGNKFEKKTAKYLPAWFNCSNDDNEYDSRSPKKGPEPESVTVGSVDGKTYAFVALERIGGIMIYDITDPTDPDFTNYINTRDFSENPDKDTAMQSDIAPEGLCFISARQSPSQTPILLTANEVSGTLAAYSVKDKPVKKTNGSGGVSSYTITATAGEGGVISPAGSKQVSAGSSQTYTVKADAGYTVADVLVNGKSVGAVTEYTFENIRASQTISASFKKQTVEALSFKDVPADSWFHDSVAYCLEKKLMTGTDKDSFDPYGITSRAMLVTVLWRQAGSPTTDTEYGFEDVKSGLWYSEAVSWAVQNNIVKGIDAQTFRPDDSITREQTVAVLYRYVSYKGSAPTADADLSSFVDAEKISDYAVQAMKWAYGESLIKGADNNRLDPQGITERCQTAAILERFSKNL